MKKRVISLIISVASMFSLTGITANARTAEDYLIDNNYNVNNYTEVNDYSFLSHYVDQSWPMQISNDMYLLIENSNDPEPNSLMPGYDLANVLRYPDNINFTIDKEVMLEETTLSELKKQINEVNDKFIFWENKDLTSFTIFCKDEEGRYFSIDINEVKKVYTLLEDVVNSFDFNYDSFYNATTCFPFGLTAYGASLDLSDKSLVIEKLENYIKNSGLNAQIKTKDRIVYVFPSDNLTIIDQLNITKDIYNETGMLPVGDCLESAGSLSGTTIDVYNAIDGDTNNDGKLTVADAAAILQYLGNAEKFPISDQGKFNADIAGDGITAADALTVQKMVLKSGNK